MSTGRSPQNAPAAPRLRFYAFDGEEPPERWERHYGDVCPSWKQQHELSLRDTQLGLSALRRKHDGVSMSRSLPQRLASGVGAGNVRWIEE